MSSIYEQIDQLSNAMFIAIEELRAHASFIERDLKKMVPDSREALNRARLLQSTADFLKYSAARIYELEKTPRQDKSIK